MVLDEADAIAFDHTVSTMAATIGTLGHPGDVDVRRAHAVGLLADPQAALDLLAGAAAVPRLIQIPRQSPRQRSEVVCVAEDLAHERANPFRRPTGPASGGAGGGAGEVVLVFHVTDRDLLDDPHGVAHSPKLGPVLVGRLRSWLLTAGTVTIKPVVDLDPAAHPPVDRHDPPARMAAAVRYRDPTCVYPRCGRPAEPATSTTSTPTSRSTTAVRPARPIWGTSRPCAAGTTAPRRSATSPTDACPTGPTSGRCPPALGSPPTHATRDPHQPLTASADEPDRPAARHPPGDRATGAPTRTDPVDGHAS